MIRFYKYIFANLYSWADKLKHDSSPEYTAFFTITFLVYCNLLTLFAVVRIIYGEPIDLPEVNKIWLAVIGVIPAIPQWIYLIYKQRYLKIIKSLNDFMIKDKLITWTYILLSIGIMFLTVFIMISQNHKYI